MQGQKRRRTEPKLKDPATWKAQMVRHLESRGIGRYRFAVACAERGVCSRHAAECLLAAEGTATGRRIPTFAVALGMARLAGLDVVMQPTKGAKKWAD